MYIKYVIFNSSVTMEISTASRVLISTTAYAMLYWSPLNVMYTTDIYIDLLQPVSIYK